MGNSALINDLGFRVQRVGNVKTLFPRLQVGVSVKEFGAKGDSSADDTVAIRAAVAACKLSGEQLYWPVGTYVTTGSIADFHAVDHVGAGIVKRGSDLWAITPDRNTTRKLYISPTGDDDNDGLSASQPGATIQAAVDRVHRIGPVIGRQQIIGAAGTYAEKVVVPDGLAQENNYLEFKFPSSPTVRCAAADWPVGGAVLDGTGLDGQSGFDVGQYNKVYIEYLLVRDWFNSAVAAASQVVSGVLVGANSKLYTYGVSYYGNGWNNLYVQPQGHAIVTGGIADGARYGINNTGGRLSMTAGVSTYTTVKNALEYGLYAKHNSSSVLDYAEFLTNGKGTGAETYGAALLAYKSGTSIDTRNCTFNGNNIVYSSRSGGHIATEIPSTDILGTGDDANTRVWKIAGFGNNDAVNYKSIAGRDLTQQFAGGSTTSGTLVNISGCDAVCVVPAGYFQNEGQYIEVDIFGEVSISEEVVQPGQVKLVFTSSTPTNYPFGTFDIDTEAQFHIKVLIYATGASSQYTQWACIGGAKNGGNALGKTTGTGVFGASDMTCKIQGKMNSGGTLLIHRVRCVLWG